MDYSTLENMLITYVPALTVLLGFLATGIGFLKNMKDILKGANITEIKFQLQSMAVQLKQLAEQNSDLKKRNNELLGELKRISNYRGD